MTEALTPPQALAKAIEFAGSQSSLARICGVTQAAVWKWLRDEKALPPQHVLSVECATGISRHTLRPDIYPSASAPTSPVLPGPEVEVADGAPIVPCDRRAEMKRDKA